MPADVDMIVIGAGPAGIAAAVNARIRNKTVMLISGDFHDTGLYKSQSVGNYLGLGDLSGADLLELFLAHAKKHGVEPEEGRVLSVMPIGDQFMVSYGSHAVSARCVIIATGVVRKNLFPGEEEFLGRGVSYCATCDGMLYRGKRVFVIGLSSVASAEADYLRSIGCNVEFIEKKDAKNIKIIGKEIVSGIEINDQLSPCEGVFILRNGISPATFMPELVLENGHIKINENMQTSVPGVFAAGDCVGAPYQINKAAGEGQKAALNAVEHWLN